MWEERGDWKRGWWHTSSICKTKTKSAISDIMKILTDFSLWWLADCRCKCSTNLMISVIVQAKSSKGNPNESWETLRYTAVWNVSHLVDNCKHLDLGRWTKGEYGPGDVYSAKYLLERHHYRRPDLVKELQNRSTQSPTRPIAAWRISKTAAVWNTCSHIKRSSCEFI